MSVFVVIGKNGPGSVFIPCSLGGHTCTLGVTEVCDEHFEDLEVLASSTPYAGAETLKVTREDPKREQAKAPAKVPASKPNPPSTPKESKSTTEETKSETKETKSTTPAPKKESVPQPESFKEKEG